MASSNWDPRGWTSRSKSRALVLVVFVAVFVVVGTILLVLNKSPDVKEVRLSARKAISFEGTGEWFIKGGPIQVEPSTWLWVCPDREDWTLLKRERQAAVEDSGVRRKLSRDGVPQPVKLYSVRATSLSLSSGVDAYAIDSRSGLPSLKGTFSSDDRISLV